MINKILLLLVIVFTAAYVSWCSSQRSNINTATHKPLQQLPTFQNAEPQTIPKAIQDQATTNLPPTEIKKAAPLMANPALLLDDAPTLDESTTSTITPTEQKITEPEANTTISPNALTPPLAPLTPVPPTPTVPNPPAPTPFEPAPPPMLAPTAPATEPFKSSTVNPNQTTIVLEDINFDHNSADLNNSANYALDNLISNLIAKPELTVEIAGYTDDSGDSTYNLLLSKKRAEAVYQYFIHSGIEPSRLKADGYGSQSPLANNQIPDGRRKNRRVELHITPKE